MDAVIWVPFLPWCLKMIYENKKHYLDVFKIDFVTSSDKNQDELLKSKLNVMREWDTLGKEQFKDEFSDGEEHWQRFWEKMPETEFETIEWIRIKNVHRGVSEKGSNEDLQVAMEKIITHRPSKKSQELKPADEDDLDSKETAEKRQGR